jgi:hypothetical protein
MRRGHIPITPNEILRIAGRPEIEPRKFEPHAELKAEAEKLMAEQGYYWWRNRPARTDASGKWLFWRRSPERPPNWHAEGEYELSATDPANVAKLEPTTVEKQHSLRRTTARERLVQLLDKLMFDLEPDLHSTASDEITDAIIAAVREDTEGGDA